MGLLNRLFQSLPRNQKGKKKRESTNINAPVDNSLPHHKFSQNILLSIHILYFIQYINHGHIQISVFLDIK